MSYSATVRRLLISCPGDVPAEDMAIVHKAINRWNGIYGKGFASAIIPISWGSHAAAEFGRPPQEILNDQLVDGCDMCIALFANRMGTETAVAESGTAEEIERLHDAGRYVAVLRSRRLVDPSQIDIEQVQRLNHYLSGLRDKALLLEYRTDAELENHVDAILTAAVSRDSARSEMQLETAPSISEGSAGASAYAEVWPRVASEERVVSDSRGRVRTRRNWYLVLANTGGAPAREIRFELERETTDGEVWHVHRDSAEGEPVLETLAPHGGEARFAIFAHMGIAAQVRCVVSWIDERGEQSNTATLRLS